MPIYERGVHVSSPSWTRHEDGDVPRGTLVPFRVTTRLRLQLRYPCRHARAGSFASLPHDSFAKRTRVLRQARKPREIYLRYCFPLMSRRNVHRVKLSATGRPSPIVVLRFVPHCRVASRNFVTGGLTKDVTRHFVDQSLDGLAPPHPHTLLKRIELAQTVPARVSRLELHK